MIPVIEDVMDLGGDRFLAARCVAWSEPTAAGAIEPLRIPRRGGLGARVLRPRPSPWRCQRSAARAPRTIASARHRPRNKSVLGLFQAPPSRGIQPEWLSAQAMIDFFIRIPRLLAVSTR